MYIISINVNFCMNNFNTIIYFSWANLFSQTKYTDTCEYSNLYINYSFSFIEDMVVIIVNIILF